MTNTTPYVLTINIDRRGQRHEFSNADAAVDYLRRFTRESALMTLNNGSDCDILDWQIARLDGLSTVGYAIVTRGGR